MDSITQISTFVKVVECGGFSAAARELHLAPSIVTHHVQALETRLGARLLNRSTRHVALTEVGSAYLEKCLIILKDLDEANSVVEAMQSKPSGLLRLNTSLALPSLLGPVIEKFGALYPDVSVQLDISVRMVDLVEQGLDLSIRHTPLPDSRNIVRKIAHYRLIVCGAPKYFETRPKPLTPVDLTEHNCLIYTDSGFGDRWPLMALDEGLHLKGNLRTNSTALLAQSALRGQGLVVAPHFLVAEYLESGALVPVLTDFSQTLYPINVVYPHRGFLPAKVSLFLDMLEKHFHASPLFQPHVRASRLKEAAL
jgi:DNA-binding transcriptional LysR family regulator